MTRTEAEAAADVAYDILVPAPTTAQEIADSYNTRETLTRKLLEDETS